MKFNQIVKVIGGQVNEFKNKKGELIRFYKTILLIDGDIWEVNTTNKMIFDKLIQNEDKEVEVTFNLIRNKYNGILKLKIG